MHPIHITRAAASFPILIATGRDTIAIRAGTAITIGGASVEFSGETPLTLPALTAGTDYAVQLGADGNPAVVAVDEVNPFDIETFAGFHFAPGGCADKRAGGDAIPAINPFSIWDCGFRPEALDPRGMALVVTATTGLFWADIYLLNVDHEKHGTSRFSVKIADGRSLDKLDYYDAVNILASYGKRLMIYDEFRAAAHGVTEKSAIGRDPDVTGLDAARTSRIGLMQATGNMWVWGTDGDPDEPRPSIFGGSWIHGSDAGSRCAFLGNWAENSSDYLSARGASDHLAPE